MAAFVFIALIAFLCEHEGCTTGWPAYPAWLSDDPMDQPSYHYCMAHMAEEGFCAGCGQFWAGIESFDFNPRGLCENCDSSEDWDDDDGHRYDYEYWEYS